MRRSPVGRFVGIIFAAIVMAETVGAESSPTSTSASPQQHGDVMITPRDINVDTAFRDLHAAGGPLVVALGGHGDFYRYCRASLPVGVRRKPISGRSLISAVAAAYHQKILWRRNDRCAVLYAGGADATIEQVTRELTSSDPAIRREGAWHGSSIYDPRIVPLLTSATKDVDTDVAWQASQSLDCLGWPAVMLIEPESLSVFGLQVPYGWKYPSTGDDEIAAMVEADNGELAVILEEMFDSGDADIREEARRALFHADDTLARVLWQKLLANSDIALRTEAAAELSHRGDDKATEILRQGLTDADAGQRKAALAGLARVGSDHMPEILRNAGHSPSAIETSTTADEKAFVDAIPRNAFIGRIGLAFALRWRGQRILELADGALSDPNPRVREAGVECAPYWMRGDPLVTCIEKALVDPDVFVQRGGIKAMEVVAGDHPDLVCKAATCVNRYVRFYAMEKLGDLGTDAAFEILKTIAIDPDATLREWSAHALGRMNGERASGLIEHLLGDRDGTVRLAAMWAVNDMDAEATSERIVAKITDASPDVRKDAVQVLGRIIIGQGTVSAENQMRRDDVTALLIQALKDPDAGVRAMAVASMSQIRGDRGVSLALQVLADQDPGVRRHAIYALGSLGDPRTVLAVKRFIADDDVEMRSAVATALGMIGGSQARGLLIGRLLVEPDASIVGSMTEALRLQCYGDPVVEQAIAAAERRLTPPEQPAVPAQPVKGGADDF